LGWIQCDGLGRALKILTIECHLWHSRWVYFIPSLWFREASDKLVHILFFLFCNATSFNQNVSGWDVSNVTKMQAMFDHAAFFNQDISNWNISNVQYLHRMFGCASSFKQNLSLWNVVNVEFMQGMLEDATSFGQYVDSLDAWDSSKEINFFILNGLLNSKIAYKLISYDMQ
jgi:surface protein